MDRHAIKIDLFFPTQDPTGEIAIHTQGLAESLIRKGIKVRVLHPARLDFKGFYEDIKTYKPDFTLSFNGVLPTRDGLFLCDILKIPHIAILTDYPIYFVDLRKSPLNHLYAQDKASVKFLEGTGAKNATFLPAAIDKNSAPLIDSQLEIPLLLWASSPSSKKISEEWKSTYSEEIIEIIEKSAEYALFDPRIDPAEALSLGLQRAASNRNIVLEKIEPLSLLLEIERYVAALGLEKTLEALKGLPLTIMAQKSIASDLPDLFPHFKHLAEGTYEDFQEALSQSKALLIPEYLLKESLPSKLLSAMAMEVLPICFKTDFLASQFSDNDLLYFSKSTLGSLKKDIEKALTNFGAYESQLHKNRDKVIRLHSWDARAEELLSSLAYTLHS